MTKAGKKRPRRQGKGTTASPIAVIDDESAAGWRKVDVELGLKSTSQSDLSLDVFENHFPDIDDGVTSVKVGSKKLRENHYDNPRLASKASVELEANPAEHTGVFMGLEVLDGSNYTVVIDKETGSKRFFEKSIKRRDEGETSSPIAKEVKSQDANEATNEVKDVPADPLQPPEKKRKKKKKAKKIDESKDSNDGVKSSSNTPEKNSGTDKSGSSLRVSKSVSKIKDAVTKSTTDSYSNETIKDTPTDEEIATVQSHWMPATGGILFHNTLYQAFVRNKWSTPAPIQAAVLPAAILGRRNIVGAAPTGSGKTLAFLLPIYQHLLEQYDQQLDENKTDDNDMGEMNTTGSISTRLHSQPLQALILTPTRELALQIHVEGEKLWKGHIGTLVGGLALAKQQRVLDKNRPSIITATPGRLWELISGGQHGLLNDLSQLKFLVIDEADRMIQQGSFPQLEMILDAVQKANPMYDSDDEDSENEGDEDENSIEERLHALPGIPGEAKVTMLSEAILQQIESERSADERQPLIHGGDVDAQNLRKEETLDDEETHDLDSKNEEYIDDDRSQLVEGSDDESDVLDLPSKPPVSRQTFIYSATLMLPASGSFKSKKKQSRKGTKKQSVDGAIAEILEKAHAKGITKVVDLTNASSSKKSIVVSLAALSSDKGSSREESKVSKPLSTTASSVRLPEGLAFHVIKCTQKHKDSFLYSYLMTTAAGRSGNSIVFCNSIAAVRRVGATLQVLGLPVRVLHAQMQQRARMKSVETLNASSQSRAVVVATDVAARGLDIPCVAAIIHYDAARSMDTFIHRSGRTARGIGAGAVGSSLSLIAPDEDRFHAAMVEKVGITFENINIDGRLLSSAQERVNLASKVFIANEKQTKVKRQNQWFAETAEEADIALDEDCLDDGLDVDPRRQAGEIREAQIAKIRLQQLLAQPMQTQKFGKFLSTNSAAHKDVPDQLIVQNKSQNPKKKRRR